ncbi:MAG: cytochrome c biogenesis protein CcdA [Salinarimonas sp.]|nr:cytochrome c biogenesis protein CcdA [Salinarimonas sp.]
MMEISILAALAGGLISFLSPCVLPLVPPYMTYLAGASLDQIEDSDDPALRKRAITTAIVFVLGFTTVFTLLGATASALGQLVRQYMDVFGIIAGVIIILMGLHFLGLFRIAMLYREARFQAGSNVSLWGAYVMGLAFAFGWTPCIGPILAAILAVAGTEQSVARGAFLLMVYSAGMGIPFILAAFAMKPFVNFLKRMKSRFGMVEKAMGGLLVLTGIAFMTGGIEMMAFWMLETFPVLGRLG